MSAGAASACTVNGRPHEIEPGETVERMLERLGGMAAYALVERNGEPVERERYRDVLVESGDTILVARPVAGG